MKTKNQILLLIFLTTAILLLYTGYLRYSTRESVNVELVQSHIKTPMKEVSYLQESLSVNPPKELRQNAQRKQDLYLQESSRLNTQREVRQNERRKLVEKFCEKTGHNATADPFHIAVIPSLKILYCVTPKAASRQLRAMLYRFNKERGELRLRKFPPDQQNQMLLEYFKFTFVREPFERILSAYKDKFVYPRKFDRPMLELHGREILKNFRPDASQSALEQLNDITFREFIEYLVTKGSNRSTPVMDWHWDNYVNICGMCAINYDFIGHYETFDQDLSDFKVAARLSPEQAKVFNAHASNKSDTASSIISYYSQIPSEWINILGEMFRANFEMFGYSFPGPLKSLVE
ncbi:hypothetical protein ACROYT_G028866 [Oculina patagonica]